MRLDMQASRHDVNWSGMVAPGGSLSLSSASICLVDRVEVWGSGGAPQPVAPGRLDFYIGGNGELSWKP